jgi:hypothetical protein
MRNRTTFGCPSALVLAVLVTLAEHAVFIRLSRYRQELWIASSVHEAVAGATPPCDPVTTFRVIALYPPTVERVSPSPEEVDRAVVALPPNSEGGSP